MYPNANYGTIELDWEKRNIIIDIRDENGNILNTSHYIFNFDDLRFKKVENSDELMKNSPLPCVWSYQLFHRIAPRMVAKLLLIIITFTLIFLIHFLV
jgi:hypothetical protein